MQRLESLRAKYQLTASPLYRLMSRRKLAELLQWTGSAQELDRYAARSDNYRVFSIKSEGKKNRDVQEPKEALQRLHRRLAILLLRIEPPGYLHSGLRRRSFVTNAAPHVNSMPAIKLDVKKFYPSTTWAHVYRFFLRDLRCAPDVAGVLATLACFLAGESRHLPTGSSLSQILAFYAHKHMFDAIHQVAVARGGVMTVYVDDMVLSMPDASPADIRRLGRIVEKQGLEWHKDRFFPRGAAKRVTGTIAKADRLEADKKQHFKYHNALAAMSESPPRSAGRRAAARRSLGLLQSIAQVDSRQVHIAAGMAQKLIPMTR
jgi:hypothetical protein